MIAQWVDLELRSGPGLGSHICSQWTRVRSSISGKGKPLTPYRLLEERFGLTEQPGSLSSHQHGAHTGFPEHSIMEWQLSRDQPVTTKLTVSSVDYRQHQKDIQVAWTQEEYQSCPRLL